MPSDGDASAGLAPWRWFRGLHDEVGSPFPLAAFRILYAVALIADIGQTMSFRHLLLDPVPFVVPDPSLRSLLLLPWMFFAFVLLIGYATRLAAFAVYALNVYLLGFYFADHGIGWQVDGVFIFGSLLLVFMPSDRAWSLKRHLEVRSARKTGRPIRPPKRVRPVWGMALAFTVATLYVHAVLWQTSSLMWLGGLGLWGPASLPYNTFYDVAPLLDVLSLMLAAGYVALVFEVVFPLMIWFRGLRTPLIIIGLVLHLGIALFFPIPIFSLVMVAFYLGFVPDGVYERWYRQYTRAERVAEAPEAVVSSDTNRLARMSAVLLGAWMTCVVLIACVSPFVPRYIAKTRTTARLAEFGVDFNKTIYPWTGLSTHGLLMDKHFHFYRSQFLVAYRGRTAETVLPMTTERGIAGFYAWNRLWVIWTLNSANPMLPDAHRRNGIKRFAAFWLGENGIDPANGEFILYRRPVKVSLFLWVEGLLHRNQEQPWTEVSRFSLDLSRL